MDGAGTVLQLCAMRPVRNVSFARALAHAWLAAWLAGLLAGCLVGCKSTPDQSPPAGDQPGLAGQDDQSAPDNAAAAGQAQGQAAQAPGPDTIDKPFLWSATKDGSTIHLLGTMHLGVDAAKQFPPWLWSRLQATDMLVLETDTKDPSLVTAIMRTDGKTLDQELGPETWAKLEAAIGAGMASGLRRFKASAVTAMLAIQGLPNTPAMDMVVAARAADAGKELVYLEKASFQMDLLDRYLGAPVLRAMLEDLQAVGAQNQQVLASYLAGDEEAMEALAKEASHWHAQGYSKADFEKMLDGLLYDRNAAWIPQLEQAAARGKAFVAVGALHLVGERGVLDLLAKRGYTIARVTGP